MLQENISEENASQKTIFCVCLDCVFYQHKAISVALACYTLTDNIIVAITRDALDEGYLLLLPFGQSGNAVTAYLRPSAFTFPESLKLPTCTSSTYPRYPAAAARDCLQNLDSETFWDGKATWGHTGLPFPNIWSYFGSTPLQEESFPPLSSLSDPLSRQTHTGLVTVPGCKLRLHKLGKAFTRCTGRHKGTKIWRAILSLPSGTQRINSPKSLRQSLSLLLMQTVFPCNWKWAPLQDPTCFYCLSLLSLQ